MLDFLTSVLFFEIFGTKAFRMAVAKSTSNVGFEHLNVTSQIGSYIVIGHV